MEFSGRDLADIQRVAGLLNVTVDELLQQSRVHGRDTASASSSPQPSPLHRPTQRRSPLFQVSNAFSSPLQTPTDLDLDSFALVSPAISAPRLGSASSDPSELVLPSPAGPQDQGTENVILLNPHTTSYDCDAALWGSSGAGDHDYTLDDNFANQVPREDDASYVSVEGMDIYSENASGYISGGGQDIAPEDVSSSWAIVSSSPEQASMGNASPSLESVDKRYHKIAPKVPRQTGPTPANNSSHRVKKKRSPYEGSKRIDTHLTRQLHACVRCRMQRNRCIPDPTNPRGPCLTCQQRTVRMSRLPCLRYMVTDSTLFRTGLDYMPFYRSHPMVGPHYGDFHLERQWTDAQPKILCFGQVGSMHIKVELREFIPAAHRTDLDLKGRPMYAVPWAIADADAVTQAITEYIERSITQYMAAYLDDTDPLVWNIFQAAYRASVFPVPNEMLRKTLRLWVACRFIESKWRCWAESGWADNEFQAMNPKDPFYKDFDSPPPYIDYQFASIIIQRVLIPLKKDVLRILQSTLNTHSPKDWFATFLTSFILLQNYEMQMLFQRQFAKRRQSQLFTQEFDWTAPRVRRMARLDAEQSEFMSQCRDVVNFVMGVETVFLGQPAQGGWGNFEVKPDRNPQYFPVSQQWPTKMNGELCWGADSFTSEDDFTLTLDEGELREIRAGLEYFNVTPDTFPLPTLGPKLRQVAVDIHMGRGFAVVRGIEPDDFSPEENVIIFLGISSYIGARRGRQDEDGNMLMHIRDAKLSTTPQEDRPTRYSSRASTFHSDTFCDILALQTRNNASSGGRNLLSSAWTVYNALARSYPHLRELLAQPIWSFDSRGKFLPSSTRPLLHHHDDRIILNFAREPLLGLDGVRRAAGLAPLTDNQRHALDTVEALARENQIVLEAQRGDMLFINNHGVLHSREAFEDSAVSPRYLVRMWLQSEEKELRWRLPRGPLKDGNARIYGDNELGEQWNVVDAPRVMFRLSERLTS
ncbi:hypothetical protein B0J18DRAFT_445394 [Chaetomium sp. MPI-SDFR-AT-0129]|nr:hypothetical protein B0J18DRAFT_445394 [Chaetomium sp. MPI-SDFR-AT-0129]